MNTKFDMLVIEAANAYNLTPEEYISDIQERLELFKDETSPYNELIMFSMLSLYDLIMQKLNPEHCTNILNNTLNAGWNIAEFVQKTKTANEN